MDGLAAVLRRRFLLVLAPLAVAAAAFWLVLATQESTWTASASVESSPNRALTDALGEAGLPDLVDFARPRVAEGVEVDRDGALVRFTAEAASAAGAERRLEEALATVRTERRAATQADAEAALAVFEADVARAFRLLTEAEDEAAAVARRAAAAGDPAAVAAVQDEVARHQEALAEARARLDRAVLLADADAAAVEAERLVGELGPAIEAGGSAAVGLGVLFAFVAIALAVGLVALAERRDLIVRDEVDAQEAIPGVPILAVIEGM